MNFYFPIFGLFLIFVIWQTYERKKSERQATTQSNDFWSKESEANNVRRKSLDNEDYITISDNLLIKNLLPNGPYDEELIELSDTLEGLIPKRILNLTGKTSTDLKTIYGVANLNEVTSYDDNYTLMATTIARYGSKLIELGLTKEATYVLEFGIDSLSDVSSNYKHLATLYMAQNQPEKIDYLIETAKKLDSLMKNSIIRNLESIKEDNAINSTSSHTQE